MDRDSLKKDSEIFFIVNMVEVILENNLLFFKFNEVFKV